MSSGCITLSATAGSDNHTLCNKKTIIHFVSIQPTDNYRSINKRWAWNNFVISFLILSNYAWKFHYGDNDRRMKEFEGDACDRCNFYTVLNGNCPRNKLIILILSNNI